LVRASDCDASIIAPFRRQVSLMQARMPRSTVRRPLFLSRQAIDVIQSLIDLKNGLSSQHSPREPANIEATALR